VIQNVAKIEQAVHRWIDHQVELMDTQHHHHQENLIRSPTLRELLEYEIEANVHDNSKLPRLKDKTAATGLLWARRQLHYQTALFANVVQIPTMFESTNAAVSASYAEVYGKYHGWAVQKIFNYSFQSAPTTLEIFKVMNPHRLQQVMSSLHKDEEEEKEEMGTRKVSNSNDNNSNDNNNNNNNNKVTKPLKKKLIGKLLVRFFNAARQKRAKPIHDAALLDYSVDADNDGMSLDVDQRIAHEMEQDAFQNIDSFLQVARPLLADLAAMFEELNMDDPSKV
jgi:Glycolipid transfer protein (GLTP)